MKTRAAALTGLAVVAATAGLLLSYLPEKGKEAAKATDPGKKDSVALERSASASGAAAPSIMDLAAAKTNESRQELLRRYAVLASDPTTFNARRALLNEIMRQEDPMTAARMIVAALSQDPNPLGVDEMVSAAARDMVPSWKDKETFAEARDLLRLSEHPKGKAFLSESLRIRADAPPSGMAPLDNENMHLASDLIQTYQNTDDKQLKEQVLKDFTAIAGEETAENLANPANAANGRYARRQEQDKDTAAQELARQAR